MIPYTGIRGRSNLFYDTRAGNRDVHTYLVHKSVLWSFYHQGTKVFLSRTKLEQTFSYEHPWLEMWIPISWLLTAGKYLYIWIILIWIILYDIILILYWYESYWYESYYMMALSLQYATLVVFVGVHMPNSHETRFGRIPIFINIFRSTYFHQWRPDYCLFFLRLIENRLHIVKRIRNRKSCINFFAKILSLIKYCLSMRMSFQGSMFLQGFKDSL